MDEMIYGVGIDMVSFSQIEAGIRAVGNVYLEKTFSQRERAEASQRPNPVEYFASRFAVKEAVYKALGLYWGNTIKPYDIQTLNDLNGAAFIFPGGTFADFIDNIGISHIHVSITYENGMAMAFVIMEG